MPEESEDLIIRECRRLATELIEQHLESRGLPLPKDSALAIYVDALIARDKSIRARAEQNVAARTDAYTEGLQKMGLIATPIDIDL